MTERLPPGLRWIAFDPYGEILRTAQGGHFSQQKSSREYAASNVT